VTKLKDIYKTQRKQTKMPDSKKQMHHVQVEEINQEEEKYFIMEIVYPYLSSVYQSLIKRGNR
jgi:hypothetical protein